MFFPLRNPQNGWNNTCIETNGGRKMTFNNYIDEAIYQDLINRYKKVALNKKELAYELGVSVSTISNCIVKGYGLPEYNKLGNATNAKVLFPIIAIAKFLSNTIKVA